MVSLGHLLFKIMIYKVEVGDSTYTEVEVRNSELVMHVAQGYEENGGVKYVSFMNFSLSARECEDLIKSLTLGLSDMRSEKI